MTVSEAIVKHMVNRFLGWRLPKPWNPDNGVSYTRPNYAHPPADHDWPVGTNLFDATQAEAMVRYMMEWMPRADGVQEGGAAISDARVRDAAEQVRNHMHEMITDDFASDVPSINTLNHWHDTLDAALSALAAPSPDAQPKGASDEALALAEWMDRNTYPNDKHKRIAELLRMVTADRATTGARAVSDGVAGFRWGSMATELHPRTRDLVARFAVALAEKLSAAERKYGYSDGWADAGWMDECRAHLRKHVEKGDPRDVAAYCAFLWHHGVSTSPPQPTAQEATESPEGTRAGVVVTEAMREAGLDAANLCIRMTSAAGFVKAVSVSDVDCEAIYIAMERARAPVSRSGDAGVESGV